MDVFTRRHYFCLIVHAVLLEHWSIACHNVHSIEMHTGRSNDAHVEYLMALKLTQQTQQHISITTYTEVQKSEQPVTLSQTQGATELCLQLHQMLTDFQNPFAIRLSNKFATRMWANVQRDGRPAEHRWRPLFNAAKFGWRPLLDCRAVTLPRSESRWN